MVEQPDTVEPGAYVRTLAATNRRAFPAVGLNFLEQYRRTGRPLLAVQKVAIH
ncbi:hypothetical protein KBK19_13835 [Microvirga sp. STR05]|uniref:Uncharacterized protein n=1 Tax=Hymenobacter duratus TaxID=2771356 RepID=A0ABR8JKL9_9BACT|nr:hypothetical protein [Hymenobacter duratus]MBD2716118.1 hypothetical protein [Hymenobacter duratus]MBR7951032.1 hypothetical protein [Microvirga sp. STR05]